MIKIETTKTDQQFDRDNCIPIAQFKITRQDYQYEQTKLSSAGYKQI